MSLPRIVQQDEWLKPFEEIIISRQSKAVEKESELLGDNYKSLRAFANGYNYFGYFTNKESVVFREWLPNATAVYLIGEFSAWEPIKQFAFEKKDFDVL